MKVYSVLTLVSIILLSFSCVKDDDSLLLSNSNGESNSYNVTKITILSTNYFGQTQFQVKDADGLTYQTSGGYGVYSLPAELEDLSPSLSVPNSVFGQENEIHVTGSVVLRFTPNDIKGSDMVQLKDTVNNFTANVFFTWY